jgi:putative acetyltransferase
MKLRNATSSDSDAIVSLIAAVYEEYGERMCLDGADSDLVAIDNHYAEGAFMVCEAPNGGVAGTVALIADRARPSVCWLKRFYLDAQFRGLGPADAMLRWALERAGALKMDRMEFWSDTRFERAQRFYEKNGFIRSGTVRTMYDAHEPYDEFFFYRDL